MKKNKKKDVEESEQLETWFQVFKRNYDNVPGFKALVKLIIYVVLFVSFVIIMLVTINTKKDKKTTNATTTATTVIKYQDILNRLLDNSYYTCSIKINDNNYIVEGSYGNNILTGTYETYDGIKKFKIKDNIIYEIRLNEEVVNNDLFKDINPDIINNHSLVNILKNNTGIKIETGYKYSNVVLNDIKYNIDITVTDNQIKEINISNDTMVYNIKYNT